MSSGSNLNGYVYWLFNLWWYMLVNLHQWVLFSSIWLQLSPGASLIYHQWKLTWKKYRRLSQWRGGYSIAYGGLPANDWLASLDGGSKATNIAGGNLAGVWLSARNGANGVKKATASAKEKPVRKKWRRLFRQPGGVAWKANINVKA